MIAFSGSALVGQLMVANHHLDSTIPIWNDQLSWLIVRWLQLLAMHFPTHPSLFRALLISLGTSRARQCFLKRDKARGVWQGFCKRIEGEDGRMEI